MDNIINVVGKHFKKSSKYKNMLQMFQSEFNDIWKSLRCYQNICWLSRWQTITTFCNSLKLVLIYHKDTPIGMEEDVEQYIDFRLQSFKYIYCLYFLGNILHLILTMSWYTFALCVQPMKCYPKVILNQGVCVHDIWWDLFCKRTLQLSLVLACEGVL